ncbi:MAG: permease prefix domain 1-containing protein [Defluviitaleaceae bacterium]|nr:permease prefix domain 1-containing protein [Defluviitaleaceae bacterium]MCL2262360.1 permease prefix domain 1-containing protein [Defluviitaleaceae bacterium]
MDVIKNYIDNVFAAYPQTDEVLALKKNMLADMEEKYTALRQNGKTEHEAAYSVIADFGNMEEITAELGLEGKSTAETLFLPMDDARNYLKKSKQSGIITGLGVWLIIFGVSTTIVLDENVIPMFVAIAIAVTMFIVNSARMSKYEPYDETTLRFDKDTAERLSEKHAAFMPRYTAMIAVGVALIILAVGAVASVDLAIPVFLNIIGFSVFLFIVAATYSSAFDALLGKGDYTNKVANKKADGIIGTVAAIYWPLVSALGVGLLFLGVDNFWIVWPVAGIIFGGICGGIAVWAEAKKKGE